MTRILNNRDFARNSKTGKTRTVIPATVLILILLAVSLFKYGVVNRQAGKKSTAAVPVVVGINRSLKSIPLVIADKTGGFAREGLAVRLVMESSAAPLLKKMISGDMDVVCAPEQLVAFLALERDDFLILAVLNRNHSQELIINTASGVYSPFGLKGYRIGLKMDSASPYFLYRKLLYYDVSLDDVVLVDMEPEKIAEKMAAGEIDAAITWPPYTFQVIQRLGKRALASDAHVGRDMYWVMVARKDWCRDNLQTVESLLIALQAAFNYMEASPEKAMAIACDYLDIPAESIRKEWGVYHFGLELPQSLLFAMEQELEWWRERKHLAGKSPDFLSLVEFRPMENLFPDKVTIIH